MKLLVMSLFICPALILSCKSIKDSKSGTMQKETLEDLVQAKYDGQGTILYNKSNTYALVKRISRKSDVPGQSSVHFFIYDKEAKKIILEDFVNQGNVEWTSDSLIKVSKVPGKYQEGGSNGYMFDTISRTQDSIN